MKKIIICQNKYLNYTCLIYILTTFLIFLYSLNTENVADFFKISSTLILLQFAAFFSGSFLGFLFGFPSHNNNQFQEKYHRNSSLKEITSWLTKIIVGVTLIEFKDIYTYLKKIITNLSISLEGDLSHIFTIGSLIGIYFILGFIVFFILSVTTIFEELVINDKNIEDILSDKIMDPNQLQIDTLLNTDYRKVSVKNREIILQYVSKNGVTKLNPLMSKRLGKFLYAMEEYEFAAQAYEVAYEGNKNDRYCLLNACYIRSKFLKDFDNSNKKLKELIKIDSNFAPAYYNLACNYNREYKEFRDSPENEYILNLKDKAIKNIKLALTYDKGLYSEACKDSALIGIDIETIFKQLKDVVIEDDKSE